MSVEITLADIEVDTDAGIQERFEGIGFTPDANQRIDERARMLADILFQRDNLYEDVADAIAHSFRAGARVGYEAAA